MARIVVVGAGFSGTLVAVHLLRAEAPDGLRGRALRARRALRTRSRLRDAAARAPPERARLPDERVRGGREPLPRLAPRARRGGDGGVLRAARALRRLPRRSARRDRTERGAARRAARAACGRGDRSHARGRPLPRVDAERGGRRRGRRRARDRHAAARAARTERTRTGAGSTIPGRRTRSACPRTLRSSSSGADSRCSTSRSRSTRPAIARPIHVVSRRGLLAAPGTAKGWAEPGAQGAGRARPVAMFRARPASRAAAARPRLAAACGVDWREVVTSLRGDTDALWSRLPLREQRRFLEHLRPFWDVHRHRSAPATWARAESLRRGGRLACRAGRIADVRPEEGDAPRRPHPARRTAGRDPRRARVRLSRPDDRRSPGAAIRSCATSSRSGSPGPSRSAWASTPTRTAR